MVYSNVFYTGLLVDDATANSFRTTGRGKGEYNPNSYARKVKADSHGFSKDNSGDCYTKDSWTVYYRGKEVSGATSSSFKVIGGGYAKDAWKVFYHGREVKDATPSSFEVIGDGYAKDAWKVFYRGEEVKGASPFSFRVPDRR